MFRKGFLQYGKVLRTQRTFIQESVSLASSARLKNTRSLFTCQEKTIQSWLSSPVIHCHHYSMVRDTYHSFGLEEEYMNMLEDSKHDHQYPEIALNIFNQIKRQKGNGMTVDTATALIEALSSRAKALEAIQVLRYSREMGVRPRINGYSSLIAGCYKAQKFTQALQVFEVMRNDGFVPKNITYSRVLSSALKSDQHQLVLEIFDDMLRHKVDTSIVIYNNILNSCARVGDIQSAMGVFKAIRERKMEMTASSYHSLIICAGKTGHGTLALQIMKDMQKEGFEWTMTVYNSVISACAKEKKWTEILEIYENLLPLEEKNNLKGIYLGAVLMAHAKAAQDLNKVQFTIDLFQQRRTFYQQLTDKTYFGNEMKDFLNTFSYNSVLEALQTLEKYQEMIDFAFNEMKQQDQMKWDSLTWTKVILAYFSLGNIEKGKELLLLNAKQMGKSTECFRFLIDLYTKEKNYREACRMSMHLMHSNRRLSRLDWVNAFENAIALKDLNLYWGFRDWMVPRARGLVQEMPNHLLLDESTRPFNHQQLTIQQQLHQDGDGSHLYSSSSSNEQSGGHSYHTRRHQHDQHHQHHKKNNWKNSNKKNKY